MLVPGCLGWTMHDWTMRLQKATLSHMLSAERRHDTSLAESATRAYAAAKLSARVSLRPRATAGDHFTCCCTCAAASERLADCLLTESGIFAASCELPAALGSSLRIPLPLKRLSAPLLEPLGSLQRAPLTCLESSRLQKDLTFFAPGFLLHENNGDLASENDDLVNSSSFT